MIRFLAKMSAQCPTGFLIFILRKARDDEAYVAHKSVGAKRSHYVTGFKSMFHSHNATLG